MTNKIEIHIISLAYIRKQEKIKEEDEILLDWLEFLDIEIIEKVTGLSKEAEVIKLKND